MISIREAMLEAIAEQADAHKRANSHDSLRIAGVEEPEDWEQTQAGVIASAMESEKHGEADDAVETSSLILFLGGIKMGREIEKEAQKRRDS